MNFPCITLKWNIYAMQRSHTFFYDLLYRNANHVLLYEYKPFLEPMEFESGTKTGYTFC